MREGKTNPLFHFEIMFQKLTIYIKGGSEVRQIDKESKKFFWFMMLFLSVALVALNIALFAMWNNVIEDETSAKREIQSNVQKFIAVLNDNKINDAEAKFLVEKQEQFNEEADLLSLLNSPEQALYSVVDELSKESRITSLQKQKYLNGVERYEKISMDNLSGERLWVYVGGGIMNLFILLMVAFFIYAYTDPKNKDDDTTQPSLRVL